MDTARHVIGCLLPQVTRVQNASRWGGEQNLPGPTIDSIQLMVLSGDEKNVVATSLM